MTQPECKWSVYKRSRTNTHYTAKRPSPNMEFKPVDEDFVSGPFDSEAEAISQAEYLNDLFKDKGKDDD